MPTPTRKPTRRLCRAVTSLATRHHVPEAVVIMIAVGSIALGVDMVAAPASEYARPAFDTATGWAPAKSWGIVLLVPSAAVLVALAARRRDLYWPIGGMALWYCTWSTALVLGTDKPGAVNSAPIIYTTVALILALLALVYLREGREPR